MPLPGQYTVIRFLDADHFDFRKEEGKRIQRAFLTIDPPESGFVEDLGGTEDALIAEVPEWERAGLVRITVAEIKAEGASFDLDPDCPWPTLQRAHGCFRFPGRAVRDGFVAQLDRAHLVRPPERYIEFEKVCPHPECGIVQTVKMELGANTREPGNGFSCINCDRFIETEGPVIEVS